jgi:hypothetical protein
MLSGLTCGTSQIQNGDAGMAMYTPHHRLATLSCRELHTRTYVTVQNNYNGKVPDIAALQCIRCVPPSVGLHQMHTIVVPSWHISAQSLALQDKPNHFLDQSRPT